MLTVSLITIFALAGGWLSRMCGGGPPKLPWGLDQWLYAIPYALIAMPVLVPFAAYVGISERHRKYVPAILLFPFTAAFVGKRTGHGGGIDLATNDKEPGNGRTAEKLEHLILWIHGKVSQYWYDVLLLSITGMAVTLVAGGVVGFVHLPAGIFLALSGLTKGPAYMIGHAIYPKGTGKGIPHLNEATAIGEFLTGFFGYGALGIVAYWIGVL